MESSLIAPSGAFWSLDAVEINDSAYSANSLCRYEGLEMPWSLQQPAPRHGTLRAFSMLKSSRLSRSETMRRLHTPDHFRFSLSRRKGVFSGQNYYSLGYGSEAISVRLCETAAFDCGFVGAVRLTHPLRTYLYCVTFRPMYDVSRDTASFPLIYQRCINPMPGLVWLSLCHLSCHQFQVPLPPSSQSHASFHSNKPLSS